MRFKVPPLKGPEVSLSYVQCFLYLISSSLDVSIFQSAWLDTFWTDLVSSCRHHNHNHHHTTIITFHALSSYDKAGTGRQLYDG